MNNEKKFIKLTPFKMQVLQSFPFIDADFDAITNYELLCKVVEYLNITVDNVNLLESDFKELYDYVHDYFANLDVQEEINNKLDDMAESGQLTDIIAQYLGLAGVLSFNNVNDMKQATNLVDGSICSTLGYYSLNDGGKSTYKIRNINNQDVVDDMTIIALNNENLVAELINKNIINLKQLGSIGDGVTNETARFDKALSLFDTIIVPDGEYLVTYLKIGNNKKLIGETHKRITINQFRNGSSVLGTIGSNCELKNIVINSLDENLNWNRFEIKNQENTLIENCSFIGFRHDSDTPNSWGLYIDGCKNIKVSNCYFEDNTQSDIAIIDGNENIVIDNCQGRYINFEPNNTNNPNIVNKNIIVSNCNFSLLSLKENGYSFNALDNITIENCILSTLDYKGANVNLINNKINNISSIGTFGGIIKNINSYGYYKNINDDPTFLNIIPSSNNPLLGWTPRYSPDGRVLGRYSDINKGKYLSINPNNANTTAGVIKDFNVDGNSTYAIRVLMNTITKDSVTWTGHSLKVVYYDSTDTQIGEPVYCCIDRNRLLNNESPYCEKTMIFNTPENCNKIKVTLTNSKDGAFIKTTANYGYLLLNKLNMNSYLDDKDLTSYSDNAPTTNIPTVGANQNKSLVGDKIYTKDISSTNCIGYVCSVSGNPGTWKKFGTIENI